MNTSTADRESSQESTPFVPEGTLSRRDSAGALLEDSFATVGPMTAPVPLWRVRRILVVDDNRDAVAGCDLHLIKPVDYREIVQALERTGICISETR